MTFAREPGPAPQLNILVLGASGLLGHAVCERLLAAGYQVTGFGNTPPASGVLPALRWCPGDFARRLRPRHWRSELPGVDVVINTIGVFHERFLQTFSVIHDEAPAALWEACASYGVKRVIHVSALGAAEDAPSEYWRSKARGDARLLAHTEFDAWVVRPSLIYADEGESAMLLRQWAALPILPVPGSAGAVQPIHRDDAAALIVRLATTGGDDGARVIETVGPQPLAWAAWLQNLRTGMGLAPAGALALPLWLVRCGVWLAAYRSHGLQTPERLCILKAGNVGEPGAALRLEMLLGRALRAPETFISQ